MFEKIFNLELLKFSNFNFKKYTGLETQHFKDAMIGDIDFIQKYMLETILHEQDIQKLLTEKKLLTQEVFSKENVKGTRIEHGFKRAFMSLFGQDDDTFTSMIRMISKYFVGYTGIEVKHFRDTLLQHMGKVKKFVVERTCDKRLYDIRVNKRHMQTKESKVDADTDDADIIPKYDEELMAEVLTGKIFASCTSKADSEPTHGSNIDISKIHECKQTLNLSAGKSQSVVAEKADISETSVIVDSQQMKKKADV
ncbi:hypothetical protein Tco_0137961 [Tanacetum coccineum]